jgi:hypothetical protein
LLETWNCRTGLIVRKIFSLTRKISLCFIEGIKSGCLFLWFLAPADPFAVIHQETVYCPGPFFPGATYPRQNKLR